MSCFKSNAYVMIIQDYDKRSRGFYVFLVTVTAEEVEQDFLVKMSDFVFITIKRAFVTFFPVSPLIRTPVNTDAINQVPLYCFCLGCGLKCLSYPLASFV